MDVIFYQFFMNKWTKMLGRLNHESKFSNKEKGVLCIDMSYYHFLLDWGKRHIKTQIITFKKQQLTLFAFYIDNLHSILHVWIKDEGGTCPVL